jgi:eukaryotic-like serine/threonine-protein kinase
MTPERWQQVKQVFQSALERPTAERAAFLAQACLSDPNLKNEVAALLSVYEEAGSEQTGGLLETVVTAMAAQMFVEQSAAPAVGQQLGHYELIRQIGAGGMGEVYLAQDTKLSRQVALKFLPRELTANEQAKKRFLREARVAATLDHPNICTIYEVGEEDQHSFIVMQYIEGETLADRICHQALGLSASLTIAVQIADALSEAHARKIIHRDIKPQNVMLSTKGQVKVLDFGLAKVLPDGLSVAAEAKMESGLSAPGVIMGTVPYMSPEQVKGEPLDARTDIFSFGVLLYEMVSGRQPFASESRATTIAAILTREPPPLARFSPEVPAELERIVAKALRKAREERYQGIQDLVLDLKNLKEQLEFEARLERARLPEVCGEAGRSPTTGNRLIAVTSPALTAATGEIGGPKAGSSTQSFTGALIRHKRTAVGALALVLTVSAAAFFYFSYFKRAQALTEKDTILLADIVNTTGDSVFDGTLKQALEVQLGQSPFLNIFPEQRVRETLGYMARSPDDRVTKEVGREICQREGIKALLVGSIASLGSHYVITLEALNSQSGEAIAREQVEAESKEQVLKTLGGAVIKLREDLGESLALIQKFDAPIEQTTTSSLEALKAYTLAFEQARKGNYTEAIPLLKRAVELDPDFALAYSDLAVTYYNILEEQLAAGYAEKAFALRGRTSEREKFAISDSYYFLTNGEVNKIIESLELWKQTYPRDAEPRNNLSVHYGYTGQCDKAIEEGSAALRLDPNQSTLYGNLVGAFLCLNRFDEAKAIFEQAMEKKLDSLPLHASFYGLAFIQGDEAAMQRQVDWANGKPGEGVLHYMLANAAAFQGQRRKSQELFRRSAEVNVRHGMKEAAAWGQADYALLNAAFGDCRQTKESAAKALNITRSKQALVRSALALALCGETHQAQSLAGELVKRYPNDTFINTSWLPTIQAALEIERGNTEQAIQLLEVARRFEMGLDALAIPAYVRGLAYLRAEAGAEALAEFQKILDHRGVVVVSALYPLAHLGVARAAALTGDTAKSRRAYQDFFARWKAADPDLPILIEAKKEYEKLR